MYIFSLLLLAAAISLFLLFGVGFVCEHWKWLLRIAIVLVYLPISAVTSALEYVGKRM